MMNTFSHNTLGRLYDRNHRKIHRICSWGVTDPARRSADQLASTVVDPVWDRVMDPIAKMVRGR